MLTTPSLTDVTRPKSSQFTSFVLMLSFTNNIFIYLVLINVFGTVGYAALQAYKACMHLDTTENFNLVYSIKNRPHRST